MDASDVSGTTLLGHRVGMDKNAATGALGVRSVCSLPIVGCCCVGRCLSAERAVDRLRRRGLRAAMLCAGRGMAVPLGAYGPWELVDSYGIGTGDPAWWRPDPSAVCSWTLRGPCGGPVVCAINEAWSAATHPLAMPEGCDEDPVVTALSCSPEHVALVEGALPAFRWFGIEVKPCPNGSCAPDMRAMLLLICHTAERACYNPDSPEFPWPNA